MEYSVDKKKWLDCESTVLKKLADGNYYVRYKETKNYYASPAAKVVVKKGNVPATNESTTNEPSTETNPYDRCGQHRAGTRIFSICLFPQSFN